MITGVVYITKKYSEELVVSLKKKHIFIGMEIELVKDGKIKTGMQSYIKESIKTFVSYVSRGVTLPATSRLFDVTEGSDKMLEEKSSTFHSTVAKLLWIIKRSRSYIETALYFLCTRVKDPDIHDWGKLRQVLQFLSQNMGDYIFIGVDNIYEVLTYVDASYVMHDYMKGHTGGCMMFGWGLFHAKYPKQKFNTKSSTDSEVIGARYYISFVIWLAMYIEHQVYKVKINQLMQDNMSAMKMEKNDRNSCTGNYRHINIRYFFFKYRVDKEEI